MKKFILFVLVLLLLFLAYSSAIFVDQSEFAYITQFGQPVATYDGNTQAGLKWKLPWPIQAVTRFDRRLQLFDIPTQEFLIRDRDEAGADKPLPFTFDLYVCWKIASGTKEGLDQFVRSFGIADRAQQFLRNQIISRMKAELSNIYITELINTDATKLKLQEVMDQVRTKPYILDSRTEATAARSLEQRCSEVGLELVDVRVKRMNHPAQVRDALFAKIREERLREAKTYRNQGNERAAEIRAEGEQQARKIRSEAEENKIRLEGQAEADAVKILNDAHAAAPELYSMVRLLKGYQKMFGDDRTQMILSLDHPLLRFFKEIPQLSKPATKPDEKKEPQK